MSGCEMSWSIREARWLRNDLTGMVTMYYIWFHIVRVTNFVSIGYPTVHLTTLLIGSVFF